MDDEKKDIDQAFNELTEEMVYEKLFEDLANRATVVGVIAQHCGNIYKAARKAGLPRRVAAWMAMSYFRFETTIGSQGSGVA